MTEEETGSVGLTGVQSAAWESKVPGGEGASADPGLQEHSWMVT